MKKICFLLVAVMAMVSLQGAVAQTNEKKHPYAFFGIQGGAQAVMNGYNFGDVINGTASVFVGGQWTPVLGTRLHINGWQSREGVKDRGTYDFKYMNATADLMVNIVTAANHRTDNAVDVYLIGGIGASKTWGQSWQGAAEVLGINSRVHNHLTNCEKLGVLMDVNFSRCVALSVELDAYHHGPRDKNYRVNMAKDWQLTGQLGLKFSFPGHAKQAKPELIIPAAVVEPTAVVEEVVEVLEEEVVDDNSTPVVEKVIEPVIRQIVGENYKAEVFYAINSSKARGEEAAKIAEAIAWVNSHPVATVTIEGYADCGTGNAKINSRLATRRANNVRDAFIKAGIAAERISYKVLGDSVQPFEQNDHNRCVIIRAAENFE